MEKETRHDLKIAGTTTAPGGMYRDAAISGKGTINGDLDCIHFPVSGASHVNGDLKAQTLKVSGAAAVDGKLESDEVRVSGKLDLGGDAALKNLKISGLLDAQGSISAEEAKISGALKVKGDCEAETFIASGRFSVDGLLNAGTIDVRLHGNSHAREIGGGTIRIRPEGIDDVLRSLGRVFRVLANRVSSLTAETIEGDDIYLECTKAKVVRGNNVAIGPGCAIDLVEYKSTLEQADGSNVGENRKI